MQARCKAACRAPAGVAHRGQQLPHRPRQGVPCSTARRSAHAPATGSNQGKCACQHSRAARPVPGHLAHGCRGARARPSLSVTACRPVRRGANAAAAAATGSVSLAGAAAGKPTGMGAVPGHPGTHWGTRRDAAGRDTLQDGAAGTLMLMHACRMGCICMLRAMRRMRMVEIKGGVAERAEGRKEARVLG